jgi:hypothetical protein
MCQKVKTFPTPVKKKTKNTPAYYQCLLNESLSGFSQPITKTCQNCKLNSTQLAQQRNSEIHLLMSAYQQMGESLKNLLMPLNNE